jgi:energy-coupling factor transport system ATP-binding protein
MLELADVTYRYPGATQPALRDVSLRLADGEVVGLVGPSEAGKSTLCLVASGLAPRSIGGQLEGRLLIDGIDCSTSPMHELAAKVGIAFQNPQSQLSQVSETVFEEVAFGPLNLGLDRGEVIRRTTDSLRALDIWDLAERDPRRLSGGQMQLVAVGGVLAMRPAHLVLDEPTSQLDPHGSRLVGQALRRLANEGAALLVAGHDTDLLADICQRVVVIEHGALVLDGPSSDILADVRLTAMGIDPPARVRLQLMAAAANVAVGDLP